MTRKTERANGITTLLSDGQGVTVAAMIGAATIALLPLIPAAALAADPASPTTPPNHACAVVLGLDPSQAPYQECIKNLEQHAPVADRPTRSATPRSTEEEASLACADIGLEPGSVGASRCIADLNQTLSSQGQIYR